MYNDWYSQQVADQLGKEVQPAQIKVSTKITNIKPLHARWIVELYEHKCKQKEIIVKGFQATGITDAITQSTVMVRVENPYKG